MSVKEALLVLLMLAGHVTSSCTRFVVEDPFDSANRSLQGNYTLEVLPPVTYQIVAVSPHPSSDVTAATRRINDHSYHIQTSTQGSLKLSITLKQCHLQGAYTLRLFESKDQSLPVLTVHGSRFDHTSREYDQQTATKLIPSIIQVLPKVAHPQRKITIEIAEESFDYRRATQCLFATQSSEYTAMATVTRYSPPLLQCTLPKQLGAGQEVFVAVSHGPMLSGLTQFSLLEAPTIMEVTPAKFHFQGDYQTFLVKLNQPALFENLWLKFAGSGQTYVGVPHSDSYLFQVYLGDVTLKTQKTLGELSISANNQDYFTQTHVVLTMLAPFTLDYVPLPESLPLDTKATLQLYASNVSPQIQYECLLTETSSGEQLFRQAIVKFNDVETADPRGRNHRHVIFCSVPNQSQNQTFEIALRSGPITQTYHTHLKLRSKEFSSSSSESLTVALSRFSVDGNHYQAADNLLVMAELQHYQVLVELSSTTGAQLDLFCEFSGNEQRHLTHLSSVNSTHVTCATPLLKAGDYVMKVGVFNGSISIFVEVGPLLMASGEIVIASALQRELAVPFSNLVRPNVLCYFGEQYSSTPGLLVATKFTSHYSLLQCAIPLGAQMSQFPMPLTLEQIVVAPTLVSSPQLVFGFAPSASYHLAHLPKYLAHSIELNMGPVTKQLSPLFDLTCNFLLDAAAYALNTPLLQDRCVFAPPLSFDQDHIGQCVSVTLSVGRIAIENKFTYCSDAFVYIKRVEPLILTSTSGPMQLKLTMNRADIEIKACKVSGTIGQYWADGSICTFDSKELSVEQRLTVQVTPGDDVWYSVSPSARLPVIVSHLPEFTALDRKYSFYHSNEVMLFTTSVVDPQVQFMFDSTLTVLSQQKATFQTEPGQEVISAEMVLSFADEIRDQKKEYIKLNDVKIPYLPRITHEDAKPTTDGTSYTMMFNQPILVDSAILKPVESLYDTLPCDCFSFEMVGLQTQLTVRLPEQIAPDLTYTLVVSFRYAELQQLPPVSLATNWTIIQHSKPEIRSLSIVNNARIRLEFKTAPIYPVAVCRVTNQYGVVLSVPYEAFSRVCDLRGVLSEQSIHSLAILNSEPILVPRWDGLAFKVQDKVIFDLAVSIQPQSHSECLLVFKQQGKLLEFSTQADGSYQVKLFEGSQSDIRVTSPNCLLTGQLEIDLPKLLSRSVVFTGYEIRSNVRTLVLYLAQDLQPEVLLHMTSLKIQLGEEVLVYDQNMIAAGKVTATSNHLLVSDFAENDLQSATLLHNDRIVSMCQFSQLQTQVPQSNPTDHLTEVNFQTNNSSQETAAPSTAVQYQTSSLRVVLKPTRYQATHLPSLQQQATDDRDLYSLIEQFQVKRATQEQEPEVEKETEIENSLDFVFDFASLRMGDPILQTEIPQRNLPSYNTSLTIQTPHKHADPPAVKFEAQPPASALSLVRFSNQTLAKSHFSQVLIIEGKADTVECSAELSPEVYQSHHGITYVYFQHAVTTVPPQCQVNGQVLQIDLVETIEAQPHEETWYRNRGSQIKIPLPKQASCHSGGQVLPKDSGDCLVNLARFNTQDQVDVDLVVGIGSSTLLIQQYKLVQIDPLLATPLHNYTTQDSTITVISPSLMRIRTKHSFATKLQCCQERTKCVELQGLSLDAIYETFTFEGFTDELQEDFTDLRCKVIARQSQVIQIQTAYFGLTYVQKNLIQTESPQFSWQTFQHTLNIPGHSGVSALPSGRYLASHSYLPTDETSFVLIKLPSVPEPTLHFDFYEPETEVVTLLLHWSDPLEVMQYAKLFYKRSEQLSLQKGAANQQWVVHLSYAHFRQHKDSEYTLYLGGRHFQVSFDYAATTQTIYDNRLQASVVAAAPVSIEIADVQPTSLVRANNDQFIRFTTSLRDGAELVCIFDSNPERQTPGSGQIVRAESLGSTEYYVCSVPRIFSQATRLSLYLGALSSDSQLAVSVESEFGFSLLDVPAFTVSVESLSTVRIETTQDLQCSHDGQRLVQTSSPALYTVKNLGSSSKIACAWSAQPQVKTTIAIGALYTRITQAAYDQRDLTVVSVSPAILFQSEVSLRIILSRPEPATLWLENVETGELVQVQVDSSGRVVKGQVFVKEDALYRVLSEELRPMFGKLLTSVSSAYTNPQAFTSAEHTYLHLRSENVPSHLISASELSIKLAHTELSRYYASSDCIYLLGDQNLLCRIQAQVQPGFYTAQVYYQDSQAIGRAAEITIATMAQQQGLVSEFALNDILVNAQVSVQFSAHFIRPRSCQLLGEDVTQLAERAIATTFLDGYQCQFSLPSTLTKKLTTQVRVYDESGTLIHTENRVDIYPFPKVLSVFPNYVLSPLPVTLFLSVANTDAFESKTLEIDGREAVYINTTHVSVHFDANWFSGPSSPLRYGLQVKLKGQLADVAEIDVYPAHMKGMALLTKFVDSTSDNHLRVKFDWLAPIDLDIKLAGVPLLYTKANATLLVCELPRGFRNGNHSLDVYFQGQLLAQDWLLVILRYTELNRRTTLLPSSVLEYTFKVPVPSDLYFSSYRVSCTVDGKPGVASVPSQDLFECSIDNQGFFGQLKVLFYAHYEDLSAVVVQDSRSYEVIPEPSKTRLKSNPIAVQSRASQFTLEIQGYQDGMTYCLFGSLFAELHSNGTCTFSAESLRQFDSESVQLFVSNFVTDPFSDFRDNVVFVANIQMVDVGLFHMPLNYTTYPKTMVLGHLEPLQLFIAYDTAWYEAYSNLRLECQFRYLDFVYKRECHFTSKYLDTIQIQTKSMPPGLFDVTLTLNQDVVVTHPKVLKLESQPVVTGLYPSHVLISHQTVSQVFYIKGRNFAVLQSGFDCVLTFEREGLEPQMKILKARLRQQDIIECDVSPHQVYQSAKVTLLWRGQELRFLDYGVKPVVTFGHPIHITNVQPKLVSFNSGTLIMVQLNQNLDFQDEILCEYRVHDALIESVQGILSDSDASIVECQAPTSQLKHPAHANVGIQVTYQSSFTPPKQISQATYNRPQVTFIPLPELTTTDQLQVYDQQSFSDLTVYGRFFHDSKGLLCLINSEHRVTALYQSDSVVTCRVKELKFSLKQTSLTVQVSNDHAESLSNQFLVWMPTQLPRVLQLQRPAIVLTGRPMDMVFSGLNLNDVELEFTSPKNAVVQTYCNSTATATEMQCFGIEFAQTGIYSIGVRRVGRRGFVKSKLQLTVLEQPTFGGLISSDERRALLDLDVAVFFELLQSKSIQADCHVHSDDFNVKYVTPVTVEVVGMNIHAYCVVDCQPDVRFLEFTVFLDHTFKLVNTNQHRTRHHCTPENNMEQQALLNLHPEPFEEAATYSQTLIFEALPVEPPLQAFQFVQTELVDDHIEIPEKRLPESYDYCSEFPETCAEKYPPYVQAVTFADDGGSTTNYVLVRRESFKTVTLHGHSFQSSGHFKCAFGLETYVEAVYVSEFQLTCTTPTYTQVVEPQPISVLYSEQEDSGSPESDYIQLWPSYPKSLHTVEMPTITSINSGQQHLILAESNLPYQMRINIAFPTSWALAGYHIRVWLDCTGPTAEYLLPLDSTKQFVTLPSNLSAECDVHLVDESISKTAERAQFRITKVLVEDFTIGSLSKPLQYVSLRNRTTQIEIQVDKPKYLAHLAQTSFVLTTLDGQVKYTSTSFDVVTQSDLTISNVLEDKNRIQVHSETQNPVEVYFDQVYDTGVYCLEIKIGEAQSRTDDCDTTNQKVEFVHMAAIWQTLDTIIGNHNIATVVKGAYLNNLDMYSISCLYSHYRTDIVTQETTLTRYSTRPAILDGSDYSCQIDEVFQDYLSSDMVFVHGLTAPDEGLFIHQSSPFTPRVINPNKLPVFHRLAESPVFDVSKVFIEPQCSVLYDQHSLSCQARDLVDSPPSIVGSMVPDYALTTTYDLVVQMTGHLFDSQASYFCLYNGDYITDVTVQNSTHVSCPGPRPHSNETQAFILRVYRDDGVFVHKFPKPLVLYKPNIITEVSPLLADSQGHTPLTIAVENALLSPQRLEPLMCKFNLEFKGSSQSYTTDAEVIMSSDVGAIVMCNTPAIANLPVVTYNDVYLSLSEFDGTYLLENQFRLTVVPPVQLLTLSPSSGYYTQRNLVTLTGSGFLPEYTRLQVRLLSTTLNVEFYVWSWDEIYFVDNETLVVRMPRLLEIGEADYSEVIFQVSINSGVSWSKEQVRYSYVEEPTLRGLSHYESPTRGHFELTVFGYAFTKRIKWCFFGSLPSLARVVNETELKCTVPQVQWPGPVAFTLLTEDEHEIKSRPLTFNYLGETMIHSVYPFKGDISGGYTFVLYGNFTGLTMETMNLTWNGQLLQPTSMSDTQIVGVVPSATEVGRAEIYIVHNLLTYQNISTYFTYGHIPTVTSCFPPLGPSRGGTMVRIEGQNFDEELLCVFDGYEEIVPIRDGEALICEMPPHHETEAKTLNLRAWNSQHLIQTQCLYQYHLDISPNAVDPQNFYTGNFDYTLTVTGTGFYNYQNDVYQDEALQIRLNEIVMQKVIFINETAINVTLPQIYIIGGYDLYISMNYGVDWSKLSDNLKLYFHKPEIVEKIIPDKIQIAETDNDPDHVDVDVTVIGTGFPEDPNTPFYCRVGRFDKSPDFRVTRATVLSSTAIICRNLSQFNSTLVPHQKELTLQFGFNTKDFAGVSNITYYPKVKTEYLNNYTFYETNGRFSIRAHGTNYLNTATKLNCRLKRENNNGVVHQASYIHFSSSFCITCTFDVDPFIDWGMFEFSIANNDVQFVPHHTLVEIIQAVKIINVWPSVFLVNNNFDPANLTNHTVYVETVKTFERQTQCFFMPTSELRAALYQSPKQHMVVNAIKHNETQDTTFYTCTVPLDLSDIAPVSLDLRIGYNHDVKSASHSRFQIHVIDRCPPGYYCTSKMVDCPVGHFCPGDSLVSVPIPCPIGYFQPKIRSVRCMPCIRGHKCPVAGMINPEPCPVGVVCDIQKLNSMRAECPRGFYCPVESTQGAMEYQNGLFKNLTQKCDVGTYCRGGLAIPDVKEPDNYESVVTECLRGMVCHQGSYLTDGVGPCPAGHYCPNRNHTGIPCPPRHYCPGRGNIEPKKCPRGTFNMHFGQQNCTNCTVGRHCPVEGLVAPVYCPAGYVCNSESLIIPINVCRIGHVCTGEVTSGLLTSEMACQALIIIDEKVQCDSGIYYQKFTNKIRTVDALLSDDPKLAVYFNVSNSTEVCCWNQSTTFEWLISIGRAIGEEHTFRRYTEHLATLKQKDVYFVNNTDMRLPQWDGMSIVGRFLAHQGFNESDQLMLIDQRHNELVRFFIQKMFTKYLADFCPAGFLCLEAVNSYQEDDYLISTPFTCPSGSYCLRGSQSVIGSGLCPIGFYCPAKSAFPLKTPAGSFTGNLGSVDSSQCSPGSFQLEMKSASCDPCPSGYECKERGTVMPSICGVGFYRSAIEANICSQCPKGTFSFERSAKDYLECLECPPGRICEVEGLKNITETAACTDGRVCFSGTGAKKQYDCPQGYFCPPQTTGETMYDNPCNQGFYCKAQTGESTKTRDNCPQTYYCPPGTGIYDYTTDPSDYSNWQNDAPTRCPRGTGNDNSDTKRNMLQCGINVEHKLMMAGSDLRSLYGLPKDDVGSERRLQLSEQSPSTRNRRNRKKQSTYQGHHSVAQAERDKKLAHKSVEDEQRRLRNLRAIEDSGRELQTNVAGKSDTMLSDLWEIMFEIHMSYDERNPPNRIRNYLNVDRQYLLRINPLNQTLCDEWIVEEELSIDLDKNNEGNKIFRINPNTYLLVSMDLRHVMEQEYNWVYGEDWEISFTISDEEFTLDSQAQSVLLPEQFLASSTSKSQLIEFSILAWAEIYIRIDILIYNALYINHKYAFINSTSVELRKPKRAVMNTEKIFIASIPEEYLIMLPFNQPPLQSERQEYPKYLISFAKYFSNGNVFDPYRQVSTKNRNIWIPASLYWNQRPQINMAYLPYFSNCNGYGQYIPLWSLLEQNSMCTQVPLEETFYMTEFSFGQSPIADNCPAITINCIYDEIPDDQQPLPRWFEVMGAESIFDIVVDPVDYDKQMNHEFDQFEVLTVAPEDGGGDPGFIPLVYEFVLSYFQKGLVEKKIIIVEIVYDEITELTPEENNGQQKIHYDLSFSFDPLSHMNLTVMFAFQSYFYIILYLLIGTLSIINISLFAIYHRIAARPDRGKIAPFRFVSFYKLTIPACAMGVGLALIPVFLINFMIAVAITGRVITYTTNVYECDAPSDSDCIYTYFDLIKDEPDNISVDYQALRNGRCGVAMLVSGAYLMLVGLSVLIPDTTRVGRIQEAYNGNIWQYYQWKRSNMVFCSLWIVFYCLALIQFSFSDLFGDWMWTIIIIMKLFGLVIENFLMKAMDEELLVLPLNITIITVAGLVTFGADDFLDFIEAYFMEWGIMIFERVYLGRLEEKFFEIVEVKLPKVLNEFSNWINNEVQEEVVDETANLFGKQNRDEDSDTTGSRVNLSDENSMQDQIGDDSDKDRDQNIIFQTELNKDNSSEEFAMQFKPAVKSQLSFNASSQSKFVIDYDSESISISSEIKTVTSTVRSDSTIEDDIRNEAVEPLISEYAMFSQDNVYLFFSPFFVLLLWVFYEETLVAKNYGIKMADFQYYFLFQLVIVPFQIVVDIINLNLTEWYHHLPMHDYLDYLAYRFTQRKTRWKGDEPFVNNMIENSQQSLDKLCFSSQFYFVQTIYVAGMCQIVLGIQTLLWAENYNMFGDFATIPIFCWTGIMMAMIERGVYFFGHMFQVWKIDPNIEFKNVGVGDLDRDFFTLLIRIDEFQREEDIKQEEEIPAHARFNLKGWNQLDRFKIQTMQLKADLQTDRLMADTFKNMFLEYNKPWLRENVQEILTPRILFARRKKIIEELGKVLGDVQPNVLLSSSESSNSDSIMWDDQRQQEVLAARNKKRIQRLMYKFNIPFTDFQKFVTEKVDPVSKMIIHYWVVRMRFIRRLKVFVERIVLVNLAPECLYCRYTYGLNVELVQNIEDMFYAFLSKFRVSISSYSHEQWMNYFKRNARYRTTCQECKALIEDRYRVRLERERIRQAIGDDERADMINMDRKSREKRIQQINGISDQAKQIIKEWVKLAEFKLYPGKLEKEQQIDSSSEGSQSELEEGEAEMSDLLPESMLSGQQDREESGASGPSQSDSELSADNNLISGGSDELSSDQEPESLGFQASIGQTESNKLTGTQKTFESVKNSSSFQPKSKSSTKSFRVTNQSSPGQSESLQFPLSANSRAPSAVRASPAVRQQNPLSNVSSLHADSESSGVVGTSVDLLSGGQPTSSLVVKTDTVTSQQQASDTLFNQKSSKTSFNPKSDLTSSHMDSL